jgi:hypothetical protein
MKEHQLQAIIGVEKNKYPQKSCSVCAANINIKTPNIYAKHSKSPYIKEIASRVTTTG